MRFCRNQNLRRAPRGSRFRQIRGRFRPSHEPLPDHGRARSPLRITAPAPFAIERQARPRRLARMPAAFFNWWSSAANGNGTRIDGLPAAASSDTAPAPERQTIRSASAKAAGISAMNALTPRRRPVFANSPQRFVHRQAGLVNDTHRQSGLAKQRPALARRVVKRAASPGCRR